MIRGYPAWRSGLASAVSCPGQLPDREELERVSRGYDNLRDVLFGPHLEAAAQSLYAAASAD